MCGVRRSIRGLNYSVSGNRQGQICPSKEIIIGAHEFNLGDHVLIESGHAAGSVGKISRIDRGDGKTDNITVSYHVGGRDLMAVVKPDGLCKVVVSKK